MLKPLKTKITFIITGLATGGAEMMLLKLLSRLNSSQFEPTVISLAHRGEIAPKIESSGIPVYFIDMKPGQFSFSGFLRLIRLLRELKPDLFQGWMYHGNLVAFFSNFFLQKRVPIVWNIRQSVYDLRDDKRSTAKIIQIGAWFSKRTTKIIYNAKISARQHESLGYIKEHTVIIPNGFDTVLFKPSNESRLLFRKELNLSDDTFLIGLIGRYHPMKDHANFFQAAADLLTTHPNVHFVLAGTRIEATNPDLLKVVSELCLINVVHLLGKRNDLPYITASLDVASSSSSYGEGFPNVVGEAMSCCVPSVVTDVGDSAWIVSDTGKVVPPRNHIALANAWRELIEIGTENRWLLGEKARQRIIENFSLDAIVRQYEMLYEQIHIETLEKT
jgi:glycosyltransferase involved in cell wall biosynthesis